MLRFFLFTLLVIGTATASVLTIPLYRTDNCGEPPQLKQTDNDLEAYAEFVSLPVTDRRMAYGQLSPERKSFFWRQHLNTRLQEHPNFTKEQKDLIIEGISLATSDWFRTPRNSSEWHTEVDEPLKSFEQRIKSVFPLKEGAETFAQIGETPADGTTPTCSCSIVSDWCWFGTECVGGGCYWTDGCGTFKWYGCTGLCKETNPQ